MSGSETGEVVEMVGRRVRVRRDDGDELVAKVRAKVVVGDRVTLESGEVASFEERKTELLRGGGRTRVICANATLLLAVSAASDPPFRPGLIDRLLVAASAAGMEAGIVLNKCDRGMEEEVLEKIARYEALGYPSFLVSALQSKGFDALLERMRTETSVLVGHSGVGKTSILRELVPGVDRAVGTLDPWGRGRHTTTSACLFDLPGGGRVIDVPGIREFGVDHIDRTELKLHFPELAALQCRYRSCLHLGEEGCRAEEVCEEDRLESYQKLMEELVS
jgi:ribosome biogenesis GTPase